ncbi:MAG: hypothetical protein JSU94_05670 [Phycisphaerales bacterium]|nr:MAG: hypothetical protein JSU94_05670 [Phycisphaerales bacterium]
MKKLDIQDKAGIRQLLYCGCVLGVKDDRYRSFGGFQLWWYEKEYDACYCCESHWSNVKTIVKRYSLDKAAKILWRSRYSLFVRRKNLARDKRLASLAYPEGKGTRPTQRARWSIPAVASLLAGLIH